MALEIPNVIAAAGAAVLTLTALDLGPPVIRTYGVELQASDNLLGVEFAEPNVTSDDPAPPNMYLWTLQNPLNPDRAVWFAGAMVGLGHQVFTGPVPTPTGTPAIDALELGQVLVVTLGLSILPGPSGSEAPGDSTRLWFCAWEIPGSGEVSA